MSLTSDQRSDDFLKISDQFKLGALTTESSHPVTATLSEVARHDPAAALKLLFDADDDVVRKYAEIAGSGKLESIARTVLAALKQGGKLFFTGCGSTGRLSIQLVSIWRDFWQKTKRDWPQSSPTPGGARTLTPDLSEQWENRAFSVMAGGDFALIKAVEGFEDFTAFGRRQIRDLGVGPKDVVFAITEGGETSFVIGTAWEGLDRGAKVYFVYNNPDDILCAHVQRSREVIQEPRIEKINLTTGPMAITGSTRMQATTIQLCVLLTVLEMVLRDLLREAGYSQLESKDVPAQFLEKLREMHATLKSAELLQSLSRLVLLEESIYRAGKRNNYFASGFGIDVLTDTTERSPTYCTPPFRKFDDLQATESWAFLFVPYEETPEAWRRIIKRQPQCVSWSEAEVLELVGPEKAARTNELMKKISYFELMRFKVGLDGLSIRQPRPGDSAVGILSEREDELLSREQGFVRSQLRAAKNAGANTGLIYLGREPALPKTRAWLQAAMPDCTAVFVKVPETGFLLDGVTRAGLKMLLNALSTCTMVRLGRVMGNYMIWVVASNLKLIDRATRYIQRLSGLEYRAANRLLFEVIEFVEPRMKADQAYPPVVGVAVMRARKSVGNEEAERLLAAELQ